jgi:23S rRNA (adenine2503-C2)-methyltransferase
VDLKLLDDVLAGSGEPAFRARQIWEWTARGADSYEAMTNLPGPLRERLSAEVPLSTLTVEREARSRDGTEKALFRTADGRAIEGVLMRYRDGRRSLCLSSQVGCALTCTFCATGRMKFARNLTESEILDQALHFRRKGGAEPRPVTGGGTPPDAIEGRDRRSRRASPVDHAVFMGMGEPLMNLDAVLAACERLPDIGISTRRTAISTVGWIPGIERLTDEGPAVRLALSLHAADEALRSELMPVNDRYPLPEVLEACLRWSRTRRQPVFVEYLMLDGVNDRYEQAMALADALTPREAFKVNLIPYNPTSPDLRGSSRTAIAAFRGALEARGLRATVRLTRGRDIEAACGQLAVAAA